MGLCLTEGPPSGPPPRPHGRCPPGAKLPPASGLRLEAAVDGVAGGHPEHIDADEAGGP